MDTNRLETGDLNRLIFEFSLPAVIGMVVFALYNIIDRMFIGRVLGDLPLSAISITLPLFAIFIAFGMLIGIGSSSMVSLSLGRRDKDKAEAVLGNAILLFAFFAGLIGFGSLFFMDEILLAFGATENMLIYAKPYMLIIMSFLFINFLAMGVNNIIRAEGAPRMAMLIMILGTIINIILDYYFIVILSWGVEGAAFATAIANLVSAVLTIYYFTISPRRHLTLKWENMLPRVQIMKAILKIGFPSFIMQMGASLAAVMANHLLLRYGGEVAVGAMGVINSIYLFVVMVIAGISKGIQPIIGYNYGRLAQERVKEVLLKSLGIASVISFAGFFWVIFFPNQIVALFSNGNVIFSQITVQGMFFYFFFMPLLGFNIIGTDYFQAVGKPKKAAGLLLFKQVFMYLLLLNILPLFMGLQGVFFAGAVTELAAFIMVFIYVSREIQELRSVSMSSQMEG